VGWWPNRGLVLGAADGSPSVHPNKQRPKHGVMASDKNFFFDKGIY
jgi:hypothetical protein